MAISRPTGPADRRGRPSHGGAIRPRRSDEAGFSLIEVVVALVVLLSALVATSSLVATGLKVGGNSRLKDLATDIASSNLDCALSQGGAALLAEQGYSAPSTTCNGATQTSGGETFTVEQDVAAGSSECTIAAGTANELAVTIYVTWAKVTSGSSWWSNGSASGKIVQETTYAPAPTTSSTEGLILASVVGSTSSAVSGASVSISAGSGQTSTYSGSSLTTSSSGCVLLANVPTGNWVVTATKSGLVGANESDSASETVDVGTGAPTTASLELASPQSITATFNAPSGYTVPSNATALPLSLYNTSLAQNGASNPYDIAEGGSVFPYSSGYTAVAGTCGSDSTPSPDSSNTDGVPASSSNSWDPTFTLNGLNVAVVNGTTGAQLSGSSVAATAANPAKISSGVSSAVPDSNCTSTPSMPTLCLTGTCVGETSHYSSGPRSGRPVVAELDSFYRSYTTYVPARSSGTRQSSSKRSAQRGRSNTRPHAAQLVTCTTNPSCATTTTLSYVITNDDTDAVTLTGTVTSSSGTPTTGNIQFEYLQSPGHWQNIPNSGSIQSQGALNASGQYSAGPFTLDTGTEVEAFYNGGGPPPGPPPGQHNWGQSTSAGVVIQSGVTVDVSANTSSPSNTYQVESGLDISLSGKSVTFTAGVDPDTDIGPTVTGTMSFYEGGTSGTLLCTSTLSSGAATCTTSSLSSGDQSITAVYSGDTNYLTGSSSAITQEVMGTYTSTSLPYGTWYIGAANGSLLSTNSNISVYVQVSETDGIEVDYAVSGSTSWVTVPSGAPIIVPVQ